MVGGKQASKQLQFYNLNFPVTVTGTTTGSEQLTNLT
jgi:hypothetical protein